MAKKVSRKAPSRPTKSKSVESQLDLLRDAIAALQESGMNEDEIASKVDRLINENPMATVDFQKRLMSDLDDDDYGEMTVAQFVASVPRLDWDAFTRAEQEEIMQDVLNVVSEAKDQTMRGPEIDAALVKAEHFNLGNVRKAACDALVATGDLTVDGKGAGMRWTVA